jgi:hypothetical protein
MAYVILFGEPVDPYSPGVPFLRTGNPIELNTNRESSEAECAPCSGSNLTLREKIMNLDEMVLVEENEDDSPSTDDQESVAWL